MVDLRETQPDRHRDACACQSARSGPCRTASNRAITDFSGRLLALFGGVVVLVVVLAVCVEWLGLADALRASVPWLVWLAVILAAGYPIFLSVLRATSQRRITSQTLMTVGLIAALAVGA